QGEKYHESDPEAPRHRPEPLARQHHPRVPYQRHPAPVSFTVKEVIMLPLALHPVPERCAPRSPRPARPSRGTQPAEVRHAVSGLPQFAKATEMPELTLLRGSIE